MDEDCWYYSYSKKRSGQIPAFGDWDCTNDLPITQYFECARQAGLTRYSSSSGDCDPSATAADLYARPRKTRERERRHPHVKEPSKGGRICEVRQPATIHPRVPHDYMLRWDADVSYPRSRVAAAEAKAPKAVDEDLYKIPHELLHSSHRKKRLWFISRCRCLLPACSA